MRYPFLFVGQGFATSYKCLAGYAWFVSAPTKVQQRAIAALIPKPVLLGLRFEREVMAFGSDDRLERYVKAAYASRYKRTKFEDAVAELSKIEDVEPARAEWKAFCDHFEAAMRAIHRVAPLRFVIKPDQHEGGFRPGPWHEWSTERAFAIAELATTMKRKTTSAISILAANLCIYTLDRKLSAKEREIWLRWLDKLSVEGDRYVRDTFVERATELRDASARRS